MAEVLIRKGNLDTNTHRRRPSANTERRWSSTSQGERPGADPGLKALRRYPDLILDF